MSIETDFPIMEDWKRFQHDLNFDPYLERQPETQVKTSICHESLESVPGADGLECGHPMDVGPPLAGVKFNQDS